jgi:hypothetical protein
VSPVRLEDQSWDLGRVVVGRKTNKQRRQQQALTAREKAAQARNEQQRSDQKRRALTVLSTVVVLAVALVVVAVIAINSTNNSNDRVNATSAIVDSVTSVSPASLQTVGKGSATLLAKPTSGDPPLTSNGKPELLYVGAEFCPFCAAERWSMVQALSRFGTLSGLSQIRSAADDGNLATFSFYKSHYTSKYLSFVPVENEDRNSKTLQPMTPAQQKIFTRYTTGYPFLYFGGKYYQTNAGYDPSILSGMNQQQIAAQLKNPKSKVAQAILGESNNLTATLCKMTNNQPANVCTASAITSLQSQLGA